jgi:protein kinase X
VQDFIPGGEFNTLLRRCNRFEPDTAVFYAAQIVLALEHLHSQGIVYRDIKPENILIDERGYLKLIDMGLAKVISERTATICGTPQYLAPEVFGDSGYDYSVDWWSFGVLLYEMLCGFLPINDNDQMALFGKIQSPDHKIQYPSGIDKGAKSLIKHLLVRDPRNRYGCM